MMIETLHANLWSITLVYRSIITPVNAPAHLVIELQELLRQKAHPVKV